MLACIEFTSSGVKSAEGVYARAGGAILRSIGGKNINFRYYAIEGGNKYNGFIYFSINGLKGASPPKFCTANMLGMFLSPNDLVSIMAAQPIWV
jgi:hypothetical protein